MARPSGGRAVKALPYTGCGGVAEHFYALSRAEGPKQQTCKKRSAALPSVTLTSGARRSAEHRG
jgi:hypothetical protein